MEGEKFNFLCDFKHVLTEKRRQKADTQKKASEKLFLRMK